MSPFIIAMLLIGSVLTTGYILFKIRRSKVQIEDSIFWLLFSLAILILGIFPDIAIWLSERIGVESPINFVFLVILFALLMHQFFLTIRLSQTNNRLKEIIQKKALDDYELLHEKDEKIKAERKDLNI